MPVLQQSESIQAIPGETFWNSFWKSLREHLNFYRVHLLFFTITPLFFSGIFYASNGRFHISYIDSLFMCVTSMTVCGLATVNLSSLTGWQQAMLFIQMCLGSPVCNPCFCVIWSSQHALCGQVLVSWLMVYIRRYGVFIFYLALSGRGTQERPP